MIRARRKVTVAASESAGQDRPLNETSHGLPSLYLNPLSGMQVSAGHQCADATSYNYASMQAGDNSIWIDIMEEGGGPFFARLNGDVTTPFRGDGS